jgi:hypothetical protein
MQLCGKDACATCSAQNSNECIGCVACSLKCVASEMWGCVLALQVWQLQQGGRLDRLWSLGRFAAGVHCVAPAAGRPWLLSATLDGFVVAWTTDSWQQLFRCGRRSR